jgi:hypothetical protein
MMQQFSVDNLLKQFISGDTNIEDLSEIIDERLFILRKALEVTSEKEILSNIELLIHEANEGYRSWDELYEYVLSIIERFISEQNSTTVILNTYITSESTTVKRDASPVTDYRLEPVFA